MAKFEKGNNFGNRFQKGFSGNPSGKTRSGLLTDALRRQLSNGNDVEKIASALIKKAISGDLKAIELVFLRLEGAPKRSMDLDVSIFDWRSAISEHKIEPKLLLREAEKLLNDADSESYE